MCDNSFQALVQRVRSGDAVAAMELHREYGEQLQRIVRTTLTDPALRRQMDSMDVCQSVFADFFVRMALGQYDVTQPSDLLKLLATMARHRVIHHAQKQKAGRRDVRRNQTGAVEEMDLPSSEETPSQIVASQELLGEFLERMSDEDRMIAEQRRVGRTWEEIGMSCEKSGEAVRKQFERSIRRIGQELGVDELIE